MSKGGKNRSWGYGSYNVGDDKDNYDDYEMTVGSGDEDTEDQPQDNNPQLIYTSFENSGKVNQYGDNGDGGHSHYYWENQDDFNQGNSPDQSRDESNSEPNPSPDDLMDKNQCYLTTACMHHYKHDFDDNCYELRTLRWFRDNFCSQEQIDHYYEIAPKIVETINKRENSDEFYTYMYNELISKSIAAIENGQYDLAMDIYTKHVIALENLYFPKKDQNKNSNADDVLDDEMGR